MSNDMPRATTSVAGRIIEFFRTAPMEVAEFAAGQVSDVLRERRAKSKAAKDRAAGTKTATPAATAAVPKAAVRKKTKKKKPVQKVAAVAATPAEPALPLDESVEAGDAPELVGAR